MSNAGAGTEEVRFFVVEGGTAVPAPLAKIFCEMYLLSNRSRAHTHTQIYIYIYIYIYHAFHAFGAKHPDWSQPIGMHLIKNKEERARS